MRKTHRTAVIATAAAALVLAGAGGAYATEAEQALVSNSLVISGPTEANICITTGQSGDSVYEGNQAITCNQQSTDGSGDGANG
ncbi:hypothetical protein [Allostreptomyces psammosilenae]|uniref:Uncharacterized protein n=1 Tax=Allostreptomyces psammosilenae TaxID=1892865 RepID=A0A852ZTC3_9ACTN|nr:hypothetical protein [Allostreptomyces psammosilenae]NYI05666.1 hypothetical protein [Allostreptomyces psammosilenae]